MEWLCDGVIFPTRWLGFFGSRKIVKFAGVLVSRTGKINNQTPLMIWMRIRLSSEGMLVELCYEADGLKDDDIVKIPL